MTPLYLIAGLGNPGEKYRGTRHNAGFDVVDRLARKWAVDWNFEKKFNAQTATIILAGEKKTLLCRPLTFMNLSGEAVAVMTRYYRVRDENLLVIVDDADLELGTLRLRPDGTSGGHHGLESVEQHLGSRRFARQRLGIGRPDSGGEISGFVLSRFNESELPLYERALERAVEQALCWVNEGTDAAMNRFNGMIKNNMEKQ